MDGTGAELLQRLAGEESARRRHGNLTLHSGTGGRNGVKKKKWRRDGGERSTIGLRRRTGKEEEEEEALFYARVTRTDAVTLAHRCGKFGTQGRQMIYDICIQT